MNGSSFAGRALRRVLRFLVVQNCFYMISGFLVLLGCLVMSRSDGAAGLDLASGLRVLGIILVYQAIVTGLAVHVRQRLGVENDAFNLACVSLVLILDPTFLSTRLWAHSPEVGALAGAIRVAVSVALLAVLVRRGRFPISRRALTCWLAALGVVFLGGWSSTRPAR